YTTLFRSGTPRPSSPTRCAKAESNSTSLEALLRFPGLSLSRCRRKPFFVPSGSTRGKRKQESPLEACARTRKASLIGAEQNHLCPVNRYPPSAGSARVALARTSEPPCFPVTAIPTTALLLCAAG